MTNRNQASTREKAARYARAYIYRNRLVTWSPALAEDEYARRDGRAVDGRTGSDLIALCHPDRHPAERAGLATRTTIRLLELRGSAR